MRKDKLIVRKSWLNKDVDPKLFSYGFAGLWKGFVFYLLTFVLLSVLGYILIANTYEFVPGGGDLDDITPRNYWDLKNVIWYLIFYLIFGFWIWPLASTIIVLWSYLTKRKSANLNLGYLISNILFCWGCYLGLLICIAFIRLYTI